MVQKNCPNLKQDIMKNNVKGYWDQKKEMLKQKFQTITDKDLSYTDGKEKEMMELLGYKLGKTREELVTIIEAL
jgi:uncharacterized protein YjbJ (UPF0337 family)